MYVNDILSGACQPNNQPTVVKESVSTALVDANNVLGATASHFAMDIAMKKAKEAGVGWVTVRGMSIYLYYIIHNLLLPVTSPAPSGKYESLFKKSKGIFFLKLSTSYLCYFP